MATAAVENPSLIVAPHQHGPPSSIPAIESLEGMGDGDQDDYSVMKKLQRHLEYINLQEEYIKDEQR